MTSNVALYLRDALGLSKGQPYRVMNVKYRLHLVLENVKSTHMLSNSDCTYPRGFVDRFCGYVLLPWDFELYWRLFDDSLQAETKRVPGEKVRQLEP